MIVKKLKRKAIEPFAPILWKLYFRKQRRRTSKKLRFTAHDHESSIRDDSNFTLSLSFDVDLPEDIEALPELLDLLKKYEIKGSFACIGKWIEKYPKTHKRIVKEGHEIINHTYSHPDNEVLSPTRFFNKLSHREQKEEIKKCDDACRKILNYKPVGFRTPHFGRLHCQSVYQILKEVGYEYSSSTILVRTSGPHKVDGILEIPMMTCPDHFFPLFDTWHCYRSEAPAHPQRGEFYNLFKKAVALCKSNGVACVFYFDPQDLMRHRTEFEECLRWLKQDGFKTVACKDFLT